MERSSYLTGMTGFMGDGSVKKNLYVLKLRGSDVELVQEIKVRIAS
jgi:hypothetical protein